MTKTYREVVDDPDARFERVGREGGGARGQGLYCMTRAVKMGNLAGWYTLNNQTDLIRREVVLPVQRKKLQLKLGQTDTPIHLQTTGVQTLTPTPGAHAKPR